MTCYVREPNISGQFGNLVSVFSESAPEEPLQMGWANGVFFTNPLSGDNSIAHPTSWNSVNGADGIGFLAKNSNAIYSKSTTVQPAAVAVQYLIKY